MERRRLPAWFVWFPLDNALLLLLRTGPLSGVAMQQVPKGPQDTDDVMDSDYRAAGQL